MAALAHDRPQPVASHSWAPTLSAAACFVLCASVSWLAAASVELGSLRQPLSGLPPRLGYVAQLALGYSLLLGVPLALLHGLRLLLLRAVPHADRLLCLLLLAAGLVPSHERAQLLAGGTGLLGSELALPLQIGFTAALAGGYLMVWLLHLALCRAPGVNARVLRWLDASKIGWFWCGMALPVGFGYVVRSNLRTYEFLVQFIMPAVWLFGASVLHGFVLRSARRDTWLSLAVALSLGGAAYAWSNPAPVRHAKAELIRRAGIAAQTESANASRPQYANLDLSRPERFDCSPRPSATVATQQHASLPVEQRRHVILISVDALRKDVLDRTVAGKPLAPALHRFAERSLVFERAITSYPATLFALGSALTGLSPSELLFAPPSAQNVLQLTASLWQTRVLVWPDVVWFRRSALPELITRNTRITLRQGAERQTDHLLAVLQTARASGRRTFAWIHYYEPHTALESSARARLGGNPRSRYDQLVAEVDGQFGRLWSELERLGYLHDSLIVVFGDHGESLGELGYFGHHVYLNRFISDIPLIVHAPGIAPGRSQRLATIGDIAPTILEWTTTPAEATDARSLLALPREADERYGLSEAFPVRGRLLYQLVRAPIATAAALNERLELVRRGSVDYQPKVSLVSSRYRLIVNRVTGNEELYDRSTDPLEEHDLAERGLAVHANMRQALGSLQRSLSEKIYCRVAGASAPVPPR